MADERSAIEARLSTFDTAMVVFSLVVGIGIFRTPSIVARAAGSTLKAVHVDDSYSLPFYLDDPGFFQFSQSCGRRFTVDPQMLGYVLMCHVVNAISFRFL